MTTSFAVLADSTAMLVEAFTRAGADDSLVTHYQGQPDEATMIARTQGYRMIVVNESRISAAVMDASPALEQIVFLGTGAVAGSAEATGHRRQAAEVPRRID